MARDVLTNRSRNTNSRNVYSNLPLYNIIATIHIHRLFNMADFNTIKQKIQDYLNVYDGKAKPYQEMAGAFERLFHDDFEHTMDDQPIRKDKMRETVKIFVAVGTQAALIFFKPLDDRTLKSSYKFSMNSYAWITCIRKVPSRTGRLLS